MSKVEFTYSNTVTIMPKVDDIVLLAKGNVLDYYIFGPATVQRINMYRSYIDTLYFEVIKVDYVHKNLTINLCTNILKEKTLVLHCIYPKHLFFSERKWGHKEQIEIVTIF